jgi:class 3 adenylate cyclase
MAAMTAKPTGTITFLFTDIQGSTKLWERLPDAMRVALARHDAIMRVAISENGGVVFKAIGDAFCAAFQHAPDALLAAVDAQRALATEDGGPIGRIKVRMALNSGEAELRDGDYFGQPLNRVARLLATGHGGQILVSTATRLLLHQRAPSDAEFRDLGRHRLKLLS